ncbi:hypothetical protein EGK75_12460, partial [Neisseria weixii]
QLSGGLPIGQPVNFEQRAAAGMFARHDSGLLVEEAAHKKNSSEFFRGNLEVLVFLQRSRPLFVQQISNIFLIKRATLKVALFFALCG